MDEAAIRRDCTDSLNGRPALPYHRPAAKYSAYVWMRAREGADTFTPIVWRQSMAGNPFIAQLDRIADELRVATLRRLAEPRRRAA